MNTDSATPPVTFPVVWNDSPGTAEKQLRLRQSFQSAQPVRAEPVQCVPQRPFQVLVKRRRSVRRVGVGHGLVQDRLVAGLLQVGGDPGHQPERIVVESRPDGVVAALGERLVLVVRAAGDQLGGGQLEDAGAGPAGCQLHEAEQILAGVAEPDAPGDPGFEQRHRPAHIEGHHALIRIPGVHHAVDVIIRRLDRQHGQR
jgi:hypothetical protein